MDDVTGRWRTLCPDLTERGLVFNEFCEWDELYKSSKLSVVEANETIRWMSQRKWMSAFLGLT